MNLPGAVQDRDSSKCSAAAALPQESVSPILELGESETAREDAAEEQAEPVRVFSVSLWVRVGGSTLALCAGIVNAVAFASLSSFVSHQTGTLSKVGVGLEAGEVEDAWSNAALLLSFLAGSTLTGFFIAKDTLHFGMALYDLCLLTECAMLVLCAVIERRDVRYLAAAACGLQNGMATHWGGAVIRTTHVTGLLTDVGLLLGRMASMLCRKRCGKDFDRFDIVFMQDDMSKLSVLATIAASFLTGVVVGAFLEDAMGQRAFLVPAGITGCVGVAYSFYRVIALGNKFFSDAEMEAVDVPVHLVQFQDSDCAGLETAGLIGVVTPSGVGAAGPRLASPSKLNNTTPRSSTTSPGDAPAATPATISSGQAFAVPVRHDARMSSRTSNRRPSRSAHPHGSYIASVDRASALRMDRLEEGVRGSVRMVSKASSSSSKQPSK
jgi:uncharacterized membrane protein YoaK (UPF0700 family)